MGLDMYLYNEKEEEIGYWRKANQIHKWFWEKLAPDDENINCKDLPVTIEQLKELKELCECVEPRFLAKLALYARNEGNMRSVSHVLAGEVAKRVKGETWTKEFFNKVVSRVDDMNEILAYYFSDKIKDKKHQPIPNAMLKGFKKAFNKFSEYQLAKYKSENK